MGVLDDLQRCVGFEWDDGNEGKNWDKHHVSDGEYGEIFFNDPLVAGADVERSATEPCGGTAWIQLELEVNKRSTFAMQLPVCASRPLLSQR